MYKFLLVDDDAIIREEIKAFVDWDKQGFNFIGAAEDGRKAIEIIEETKPDVILTDICMPFLDGLELAKFVSERLPSTKVIVLTGYDDFDYAQKSIKLNVYDFILKPITPVELLNILSKVKNDLDDELIEKENIEELKNKINESMPLLKERFLNKIVSGRLSQKELNNRMSYFSIQFKNACFSTIVFDIDNSIEYKNTYGEENYEVLSMEIYNNCLNLLESSDIEGQLFYNSVEYFVLILNYASMDEFNTKIINLSEMIRQTVEERYKVSLTIGIGTLCNNLLELPVSYQNAVSSLEYRFQLGTNQIISYSDLINNKNVRMILKREWGKEIIFSLKTEKSEISKRIIKEMITELKISLIPIEKCNIYLQIVIASIYSILEELEINETSVFGDIKNPFVHLSMFKTLDNLEKWFLEIADKIGQVILEKKNEIDKIKILKAEQYIRENYNNEEMTLSSICLFLCTSKSRFSPLFKKYTGQTFIEYLTRFRIEKAMELLRTTTLKTYEIAYKTGFYDPHYFTMIFKKINNMTPSQFRGDNS